MSKIRHEPIDTKRERLAMADKKKKTFISPVGIAQFVWLRKADTKFDAEGKFKVTLQLDSDDSDTKVFTAQLDSWVTKVKGKNAPYTDGDGVVEVKFKSSYPPSVFDAHRNIIPAEVDIGSGSKVKVAFQPNHYESFGGGINLYLQGVQVIDLVEYSGQSATSMGFDEEEGFAPESDMKGFLDDASEAFDKVDPPPPTDDEIKEEDDENLPF